MTTIGEKTADVSTLLDDIVAAAVALADWSDADPTIVNDGSTGDWWNNGRVLTNVNTGTYVLLYHTNSSFRTQSDENDSGGYVRYEDGLRVIHSTQWDSAFAYASGAPAAPSGLTNVDNRDGDNTTTSPYDDVQENPDASTRAESYPSFTGHVDTGIGIWVRTGASGTTPCSYVGSVGANHIAIAAWGQIDIDGAAQASIFAWEHLTSPFWTHGIPYPVAMLSRNSHGESDTRQYTDEQYPKVSLGFTEYYAPNTSRPNEFIGRVGSKGGVVGEGRWGYVNPDATDDSLFYRRVPVYTASDQGVPVAELDSFLPSEWPLGPGHGLQVTADTINYYSVEKTGNGHGHPVKAWVRYD